MTVKLISGRCEECRKDFSRTQTFRKVTRFCSPACGAKYAARSYRESLADTQCRVDGCIKPWKSKGIDQCAMHYTRKYRVDNPVKPKIVDRSSPCEHCGKSTNAGRKRKRYCSTLCANRAACGITYDPDRTCTLCDTPIAHEAYYRPSGVCSEKCAAKAKIIREYGIEVWEYRDMYDSQNGACLICQNKDVVIDHCHYSKMVRGLICNNCNMAIGLMGDDPYRLRKAAAYIEERAFDSVHRLLAAVMYLLAPPTSGRWIAPEAGGDAVLAAVLETLDRLHAERGAGAAARALVAAIAADSARELDG